MSNTRIIERMNIDPELLITEKWPLVHVDSLSTENKDIYLRRKNAVDLYFKTEFRISDICNEFRISHTELQRLVNRCLGSDPNGNVWGYRALIPYKRLKDYKRKREINSEESINSLNGAFIKLLEQYPLIKKTIDDYLLNKKNRLPTEPIIRVVFLHKRFLKACRLAGLTPENNDYPFNTKLLAQRSLYRYAKALETPKRHSKDAERHYRSTGIGESPEPIIAPYKHVEFDGHKIDAEIAIKFTTPEGDEIVDVMRRIWILVVIDKATRAILGYHLCLSSEYSLDDVLKCIRNAIVPWKAREFSIPGLTYPEMGGFPSGVIEKAKYALWDEISYDNAKANLANMVQNKLRNVVGCAIKTGPVGEPERRELVEKFFHLLEIHGFQRMINTTGNNPKDPRRNNSDRLAIKYEITADQIEEITEVLIAQRNGEPQSGTNYLSPLEVMAQRLNRGMLPRYLEEVNRRDVIFLEFEAIRTIRGDISKGKRPYISFEGAEYRNDVLARGNHLIGQKLTLIVNTDDLRYIRAFLEDGSELGMLQANGKWSLRKHSLRIRKQINKLKRNKLIYFTNNDDPIEAWYQFIEENSREKKSFRNSLESYKKEHKAFEEVGPKEEVSEYENEIKENIHETNNNVTTISKKEKEVPVEPDFHKNRKVYFD